LHAVVGHVKMLTSHYRTQNWKLPNCARRPSVYSCLMTWTMMLWSWLRWTMACSTHYLLEAGKMWFYHHRMRMVKQTFAEFATYPNSALVWWACLSAFGL